MHETFPFFMREKVQAEVFCHLHVFRKHLPFLISERTVTQKIAQARTVVRSAIFNYYQSSYSNFLSG